MVRRDGCPYGSFARLERAAVVLVVPCNDNDALKETRNVRYGSRIARVVGAAYVARKEEYWGARLVKGWERLAEFCMKVTDVAEHSEIL
jgi:hypothetical protein